MHGGITYGNRTGALKSLVPEPRSRGQILERPIAVANPQIPAATHRLQRSPMVAEYRTDGREIPRNRNLRYKQDGVGQRPVEFFRPAAP